LTLVVAPISAKDNLFNEIASLSFVHNDVNVKPQTSNPFYSTRLLHFVRNDLNFKPQTSNLKHQTFLHS
jgi:hypothetical protein